MDIYTNTIDEVKQFVEKKLSELGNRKEATITQKQASYKIQTTDKLIEELAQKRDEAIAKLNEKYNSDVKAVNLGYENKKNELIEKGNVLVKAEEDIRYENGVACLKEVISFLQNKEE